MAVPEEGAGDSVDVGMRRLEGYLLWQSEVARARADAEETADRLDWLTGAQREAVVACFAERQLVLSRRHLERTARRARELREEYEDRYATLKARLLAWTLAGFAATAFVSRLLL
ncbi:hypothetical protein [Streptomyces sp. NA02536]|uniref:hypothetical protein n=1 Tax=Streptomyces sp. NA02536 TaxID=2742133 RepID=UPI001590562C|nr:hypothetical protein [Streptomyces sp. NA02536]QKW03938.1 hypothetical protein HUT14_30790 [Streptomyces sp. NA02536]